MKLIHRHFDTIDSTNTWAKNNAQFFQRDSMTLVTADTQTGGRGRFKRQWLSPPKQNIYASYCFFLEHGRKDIGNIPQVLAISTAKILEELGFKSQLKWPNDVLISGKKVAGILAETVSEQNQLCMIIGIGLNINMPLDLLLNIDRPATSLLVERGCVFLVKEVLEKLSIQFNSDLSDFFERGFSLFLEEYKRHLNADKQTVMHVSDCGKVWSGIFENINDDGSLQIRLNDGILKSFHAGEILWPGEA